jgi:hypothetical protein
MSYKDEVRRIAEREVFQQTMFPDLAPEVVVMIKERKERPIKHDPSTTTCDCVSCRKKRQA